MRWVDDEGNEAPDDQENHHYGGDLHDAQRLFAGLVDALGILPPKVRGHDDSEGRGEVALLGIRQVKG